MKHSILFLFMVLLIMGCTQKKRSDYQVTGVSKPIISLNGEWRISLDTPGSYETQTTLNENWKTIQVPGEAMMQGFPIDHDEPFVYQRQVNIPADYEGKKIIIRFDGVYCYARVWVNGHYVRDHHGGFTRWECDLTEFAEAGERNVLTVEVTDRTDQISYASGYAKHPIGGILRDVTLMALPQHCPGEVKIETELDNDYRDATLSVAGKMNAVPAEAELRLSLFDEKGNQVKLDNKSMEIQKESFRIENKVTNPMKWDAEHPKLYNLQLAYYETGEFTWRKTYRIGFREVEVEGNKLLVNGKPVKLRGANRHDVHPLLGRVSTPEYERKDVMLAKEANMNFIRTSHYPPTENFLELCDKYGIYVESESAVCFVGTHRMGVYKPGNSEDSAAFRDRYLTQMQEMVTDHMNHPSVVIWSTGNENSYGSNFKASYDWVKQYDTTRPVMFSYPGNVPDSVKAYDILSMHYPPVSGDMNQRGIVTESFGHDEKPVLFDEWAHVACYNKYTAKEDPNVRNFWGRSLDKMWKGVYEADGGLGGAIWGMIDETFMLPKNLPNADKWLERAEPKIIPGLFAGKTIGYGEWGIIDTWRRKKPEFWNTKKAYSPVKILKTHITDYSEGETITLPVYNRFDHTNLIELAIKQTHDGEEQTLETPDVASGDRGTITLAGTRWDEHEPVILEFYKDNNRLIDKYAIRFSNGNKRDKQDKPLEAVEVEEKGQTLTLVCGDKPRVTFDKATGLISKVQSAESAFAVAGPYINLRTKGKSGTYYSSNIINNHCTDWQMNHFKHQRDEKKVSVSVQGEYNQAFPVEYTVTASPTGDLSIEYRVENIPKEYIREIGLRFKLEDDYDALAWQRDGYWSIYPNDHLSPRNGKAPLYTGKQKVYREKPGKPWNMDAKSFFYQGTENEDIGEELTHIAKSTKEQVCHYALIQKDQETLSVHGEGDLNCRLNKEGGKIYLFVNSLSDYVNLNWGNYQRNILLEGQYADTVKVQF